MTTDSERAAFEAWFKAYYIHHGYITSKEEAWNIWQAREDHALTQWFHVEHQCTRALRGNRSRTVVSGLREANAAETKCPVIALR